MKKIHLFYKKIITPGGAERLLLKEYEYFKSKRYDVKIVCFFADHDNDFFKSINSNDIIVLNSKYFFIQLGQLSNYIKKHKDDIFICNSGHVDFYLASIGRHIKYYLHIHHPSFMSFNEKDKYSLLMGRVFSQLALSNYGADRFFKLKKSLSITEVLFLNIRSIFSYLSIKKAKRVFVLSNYAKLEKKIMYGIDAISIRGGLENSIFEYVPEKVNSSYPHLYRILTIARLDKNKRIDVLINAFHQFLKIVPNAILLIGGNGPEKNELQAQAENLKISEKVVFLGYVKDKHLYDYYADANLFVSIDWADYRITSYEAMAMGTPVLLSDETDPDQTLARTGYYELVKPEVNDVYLSMLSMKNNQIYASKTELNEILKTYTWSSYFQSLEKSLNNSNV